MAFDKVLEAIEYAADLHKDQRRKGNGGSPYINHLIEVVSLLSHVAKVTDTEILIASVLHDALEDTHAKESEILSRFGENVLDYVRYVTDDKSLSLEERREAQLNSVIKSNDSIKLIKLADHCSNISSLPPLWDKVRLTEYIAWSHSVASQCYSASSVLTEVYKQRYSVALENVGDD